MASPYNDLVLEHFKNPRNTGRIEDPDGKATEGSPACGDMVSLYLKVDPETKKIDDIKFESYGCASNIATGSIITELAKGKTIDEAKNITWQEASEALGGLPKIKAHCSVLAVEVLRSAIQNYEEKHGLVTEKVATTEEIVRKRLKKVMNPIKGLDMVATHLVKEIDITGGVVRIVIDLPETHQFANAIKEDAVEKIESLWDIDQVIVEFTD
ncbi:MULTISPECIES: iron-sulfur cluster assembly scaffold protein [Acetobacterium]|jgi:NifU-like protein involved in Fe-S cluster formation/metal-sulfur cluster biosynthetic enzyme|uniref:iron-sulfur cluster assembly scaffold protein n=1 Tax=Acetobacterium TaxID=33951 RepID=UPI002033B0F0|nr:MULTISPECIES: iron-sulfur cluster assembly scaffold protein [Acetobacterium]URN85948.1 iron-sulfur cluster assembly scaffold protein [Acetobacterium wieringae]